MARHSLARRAAGAAFAGSIVATSLAAVALLLHVAASVVAKGLPPLLEAGPRFFVGVLPPATSKELSGGIGPALAGSFMTVSYASLIALPLSFFTGVFLAEFPRSSLAKLVKSLLHFLLEFPTVMVGMLAYAAIVVPLGSYSMAAAAVALAIIMTPYVALGVEEALRTVPIEYKEAGYSLGLSRAKVALRITVKIAATGVATALLIGVVRGLGETAALLFTAGRSFYAYPSPLPIEHLTQPVGLVPLLVYHFATSPYGIYKKVAWAASFVLFTITVAALALARKLVKEVRL